MIKKFFIGLLSIIIVGIVGIWLWWPEEMVVKGPTFDFMVGNQVETPSDDIFEARFKVPNGLQLGVFAKGVNNARTMKITATGDMLVASYREGNVILLHADRDGDGISDGREILLSGMNVPYGLAIKDGYLYVAETDKINRMTFNPETREIGDMQVIFDRMPGGGNHKTRTLKFGPDGMLYVTVGSSCNVCLEESDYRATMLRMNSDGTGAHIYASGLRNTVGFDWQPGSDMLFGTDNGRDLMGDETPHCELNHIIEGGDYGWPYAYDDRQPDPDFGAGNEDRIARSLPLVHGFGAHRAPLGIKFISGKGLTSDFEGAALVALHGSWNRSTLAGYKVVSLHFGKDGTIEQRDFMTGFELDENVIGRPAHIEEGADGSVYISDDYSGTIFRVSRKGMAAGGTLTDEPAAKVDPLEGLAEADIARNISIGGLLFTVNNCASCHIQEAAAEGVQVKELVRIDERYDIESLMALLKTPPGAMPTYDFSEEDRRAIAVYLLAEDRIKALDPPDLGVE